MVTLVKMDQYLYIYTLASEPIHTRMHTRVDTNSSKHIFVLTRMQILCLNVSKEVYTIARQTSIDFYGFRDVAEFVDQPFSLSRTLHVP